MSDDVPACRNCGDTRVRHRRPDHPTSHATHEWYCIGCGGKFDDVDIRPRHQEQHGLSGLARKLYDADPEEVL